MTKNKGLPHSRMELMAVVRVGDSVLSVALRTGSLLLERAQEARRRKSNGVDGTRQHTEVDGRTVARGALLIELASCLVLKFLLLSLRQEGLDRK